MVKETLTKLAFGKAIDFDEAALFIDAVVTGEVNDSQIAAFLTALRIKGETPAELAGCISALRRHAVPVPHHQNLVFDCCGPGGDGSNSFNVSTAAAFVIAACGVPTAKHGNRAVSSACGSADILEEAGAKIDITAEHSARLLDETGFCFLFAPLYHPATKRVALVRRELGFPTVFNLLGPLLNPARTTHQIVGTSSRGNAELLARTATYLPSLDIITYSNSQGLDELLPSGENYICRGEGDKIQGRILELPPSLRNGVTPQKISGGGRKENLTILIDVLSGRESAYLKVTALNAALGLLSVGKAANLLDGHAMAEAALRSGSAKAVFECYVSWSNEVG
jgi:anthranilate phosphoribosyltransferase